MIIGISGRMGTGKDTLGDMILKLKPEFEKKGFSDKLKTIGHLLSGIPVKKFNSQNFKKGMMPKEWDWDGDPDDPMTVREFLQNIGTDAIREAVHEDAWVISLMSQYKIEEPNEALPNWVIADVRFPNEAEAIRKEGGILIRINRKIVRPDTHDSELAMNDYGNWHEIYDNDYGLEELEKFAKLIVDKYVKE
jgi:hypothetical protein